MKKTTLRRALPFLRPYGGALLLSFLAATVSVLLTLYVPILIGNAIDCIVVPGETASTPAPSIFPRLLLRIAFAAAGASLAHWLMSAIHNRVAYSVVRDLRDAAFAKLQSLPISYLDSHAHGELISRMIGDADTFADGLLMGFAQLFTGILTIVGTLLFMFVIRWQIALVVVLVTPLSLFAARFIASRTHRLFGEQSALRGEQTALIHEMVDAEKTVRAYGHEAAVLSQFEGINRRLSRVSRLAVFFSSTVNPMTRFVNGIVYAGVGLVGALAVMANPAFTVGSFSVFLSYANQYTKPFNEISGVLTELQNALTCADRVFSLIDEAPQTPDAPDARVLTDSTGDVALSDVCFSYTPKRPLLRNLCLSVPGGTRVALVGPTGCGKTTLINLLMRFYEPDAGEIRIDGVDIRAVTRESLRKSFGMVLQDTWIKTATVRENIALGKPDATDAEIERAARAAHAHSFIRLLPRGYDTVLRDDGTLSQGQKQLLCIARLFLCSPPMLILDEATSSIDTRTEMEIQNAFAAVMRGKTCFIVAHRLSTVREADLILVMRDGEIVERGTHASLLAAGGFYAELYQSQFAGL